MSAHSQPRHEVLFYEAVELPVPDRPRFLDEACGGDGDLRAEVEELLQAHEGAADFLPQEGFASRDVERGPGRAQPERPGDRIGPYKLLEQIGEGGFGVVWVAEQEKPVRRRVALKIIKPGMDTREVIARFEQERQALAMMDHPNIARVLDAGATPLGRPYFVMELVRGTRITEFCDHAKLSTADRLRIFIAVCHAVQHAHQKGIIHRDLKPSNILVTLHDGVPVPKVIDFGIAKATQQQRLTDLTIYTRFEQMIGTPLYMSPEQAEMSGLDIDTRSDIYSLGVLLYELLVGRTPFDPETLMKRGLDEIRRVVREQEPQKPSTFISTMALDLRTDVAQHRQTDGTKLIGQIRGDLDWIVMKALEKDRVRRYETATSLAEDIQRHLVSEPIQARPASQFYRFRRFAKRNKIAFAAGTGIAAALLIGIAVSTWMFFKEKQARERAVAAEHKATNEASKSQQVAAFLKEMLSGVGPSVALGRDTTMLREIVDKTAERVGKDLNDQPEVEAELCSTLGSLFSALGQYKKAEDFSRRALGIRRKILGSEHYDVGSSLSELGSLLSEQDRLSEAEMCFRESLVILRKLFGEEHPDVARALQNLASVLQATNTLLEAEALYRQALTMGTRLLGRDHPSVANILGNLGYTIYQQGRLEEAEKLLRSSLALNRKLFGSEHPQAAVALNNLAAVLEKQQKLEEAEINYREALALNRKLIGRDHPRLASSLSNLANVLRLQSKFHEAERLQREALELGRKFLGPEHPDLANYLIGLAITLGKMGQQGEAEMLFRKGIDIYKLLNHNHPRLSASLNDLAYLLQSEGRLAEAEAVQRESLEMARKLLGNEHPDVALYLHNLACIVTIQGKPGEAEPIFYEAVSLLRKLKDQRLVKSLDGLARVLREQSKSAEEKRVQQELLDVARTVSPK